MATFQEQIQEAEVILRGSRDPEQRALALDGLRRILKEAGPTAEARRAAVLIDQYDDDGPRSRDRELAEYERRWAALQGLTDPELLTLLGEMRERYHIAARLLQPVVRKLRAWVDDAIRGIAEYDDSQVLVLNKFVELISSIDIYHVELGDLKNLRNVLFGLRYNEVSRRIDDALRGWSDGEAWGLLELLADPPGSFAEDFAALQEKIYGVGNVKKKVEALLEQPLGGEPAGWADVSGLVRYSQDASKSLTGHYVPEPWRGRLARRREGALDAAAKFLEKQAVAAVTPVDVRAFWAEYEGLDPKGADPRLEARADWFQNFLEYVGARVRGDVKRAKDPQTLDGIAERLRKEKAEIPGFVAAALEPTLAHLGQVSAAWAAMRAGAEFAAPPPAQGPTPEEFERDEATYGGRLARVSEAFARLDASPGGAAPERACREALDVARSVLSEQPGHLLAARLEEEAERRVAGFGVDAALAAWDFGRLFELCRGHAGKWPFSYYAAHEDELRRGLGRAVTKGRFASSDEAQAWWADWKEVGARLPAQPPAALAAAVRREEEKRRDEWAEVLGELIDRELSPEECDAVALSLREGPEDLNLRNFQKSFERKAEVGRAFRHIKAGEWDDARRVIGSLDETLADTRRLKIHLEVERARKRGVEALAEVLKGEWGTVKSYFKDALTLLLRAVEDAWEAGSDEAVESLREVTRRVLAREPGPDPQLEQLRKWEEWFTVEQAIKGDESAASLKRLIAYLKENDLPDETLRARVGRLVEHWRGPGPGNLVMLALADQMFGWLSLSPDPAAALAAESDAAADAVLDTLGTRDDLGPEVLNGLQQELGAVAAAWRRLGEYLDVVNESFNLGGARRLRPSEKFERAKELLAHLVGVAAALDELAAADLRRKENQERLEAAEGLLMRDLRGVRVRDELLKRAARLAPLARLNAIEKNIDVEARRCRSDRDADFYEPGAFARLAARLRELAERFRAAGLQGGPMWRVVSEEYCAKVYALACVYAPPPRDLKLLADDVEGLDAREREFRGMMDAVWAAKPSLGAGSAFNPGEHVEFLRSFPQSAPLSRRDYLYFKYRYAEVEPLKSIILRSLDNLPAWVRTYSDEGIPSCADEA